MSASSAAVGLPRLRRIGFIVTLGLVTAIPPFAVDTYIPAFPAMRDGLGVSEVGIQLTLTAFLIGIGVGQLVIGSLSDAYGRRQFILWGTVGFILFSILCAIAPVLPMLIAGRFAQGVCGAAGMVLARSVVYDVVDVASLPRYFGALSAILGVVPVIAPLIGAVLLEWTSWRGLFVFMAVMGVVMFVTLYRFVPESLPPERRSTAGLGNMLTAMRGLLLDRQFCCFLLSNSLATAAILSYIGGTPFVMESEFGTTDSAYAIGFSITALALVTATTVFMRLSRRFSPARMLVGGLITASTGCLLVLGQSIGQVPNEFGIWAAFAVFMAGMGFILPSTLTGGQLAGGAGSAGAASALLGGVPFLFSAAAAPVAGLLGDTLVAVAGACLALVLIASSTLLLLRR